MVEVDLRPRLLLKGLKTTFPLHLLIIKGIGVRTSPLFKNKSQINGPRCLVIPLWGLLQPLTSGSSSPLFKLSTILPLHIPRISQKAFSSIFKKFLPIFRISPKWIRQNSILRLFFMLIERLLYSPWLLLVGYALSMGNPSKQMNT